MFDQEAFMLALTLVFNWPTRMWIAIGVTIGVGVGAMPGLSATTAVALMLPVTFTMVPASAFGLLIGLYKGAVYGGSISAISFSTPGSPEAAATVADGHTMMKQGKGLKALTMALYASVTADFLSDVFTVFAAPLVAVVALSFGPSEQLWLVIIAVSLLGAMSGNHPIKGMLSAALGLGLASIGSDPISSVQRLTFGQWWLSDGIGLVPLVIGLFAVGAMLEKIVETVRDSQTIRIRLKNIGNAVSVSGPALTFKEYISCWKQMALGLGIGTFVGLLPGLGATVAAFVSFAAAKQIWPEKNLGSGTLEGIAAAESGNNATVGPTLVPLLAFGIPGSATAALIGGALMLQGITPGPQMFELFPEVVYSLFIILLVANFFNLGIGRFFATIYARLGAVPTAVLAPVIILLAVIGTYSYQNNSYDVMIMLFAGVLGYLMQLFAIPVAPLVIMFLLAPMAEESLRRALLINQGDWGAALFGSNLSVGLVVALVAIIAAMVAGKRMAGRHKSKTKTIK